MSLLTFGEEIAKFSVLKQRKWLPIPLFFEKNNGCFLGAPHRRKSGLGRVLCLGSQKVKGIKEALEDVLGGKEINKQ